ncbi:MAG: hypothetical protein JSV85_03930 [Candidatus Bathyarchaeota archaeon]|nr:MAG: hypothetical protein JSV85_03930 [Candidatus Bathyarchaeota archaeon]
MDTSAFIAGFDPLSIDDQQYSAPMVEKELFADSMPCVRFNAAVEEGSLKVRTPSISFLKEIEEASKKVGDLLLSNADQQVLALASELKDEGYDPLIVTDDYSIQNVAHLVGVEFASLITFGIRFRLYWIKYCPACHRKYPSDYKHKCCEVCGTSLKRRPLKRKRVRR